MGNSHSQHHQIPFAQWAHSYPRPRHGQPQVKVLPEGVPPLQLRTTDNGAILQNGGTISCRKQSIGQEKRVCRPRSSSAHRPPKPEDVTLEKSRFGSEPDLRFHSKEGKDQFCENAVRQRISRSRKKYKAPPAPHNGTSSGVESSSPDLHRWESNEKERPGLPCRKGRLFKTRAETNKKNLTGIRMQNKMETMNSMETLNGVSSNPKEERARQDGDRAEKKRLKRSASQEVVSTKRSLATPEFQAELLEAAQRLRPSEPRNRRSPPVDKVGRSEARDRTDTPAGLGGDIPKESESESRGKALKIRDLEERRKKSQRGGDAAPPSGSDQRERNERDVPFKKFYFGMKESDREINVAIDSASINNVNKTNVEHMLTAVEKNKNLMNLYKSAPDRSQEWEETVDRFAANFQKAQTSMPNGNTTSCSSSFISDPDEDVDGGIALQLRPTLPKKTLEIPRFSPTAAWRLLSSVDAVGPQAASPGGSDDGFLLPEDGIRPPAPHQVLRSSNDKSGDSGISGDASPGGCQESSSEIAAASPKPLPTMQNNKNILMAWTPQQDLEEESSSEDFESPLDSSKNAICQIPGARFSPRGQLFVTRDQSSLLSVQREDIVGLGPHVELGNFKERYGSDLMPGLNSLKKLKVALGSAKRNEAPDENGHSANENWVLSRSVPGSLNKGHVVATRSVSDQSSPEQDEEHGRQGSLNYSSYSYLASGGRIMYLPEYHSRMSPDVSGIRPRNNMCNRFLSKSCENVTQHEMKQLGRSRSPSPVGIRNRYEMGLQSEVIASNQKKKKFTFQSTVRLLENRRIAERLSREAELKENQRLSELEAMKKVEEEFQKKRAREKANIRHQLRLFSLEEKNYSSLPTMEWDEGHGDSAPSSFPHVSHSSRKKSPVRKPSITDVGKFAQTTQILSEYKEPTRDYRDYRHFRFCESQDFVSENNRSVVEHPKMVYDMPKNTAVYVSAPVSSCVQHQHKEDARIGMLTPRSTSSDNYRKDFAHGAPLNPGRSLTSSDSELSQPQAGSSGRGLASRRFTTLHGNRSTSPDDSMPKTCPSERFDSLGCPPRRRSISPNMIVVSDKNRSCTPTGNAEQERHNDSPLQKHLMNTFETGDRLLSHHEEAHTEVLHVDAASNTHEFYGKTATDSLLRLGFPSLQPFNREEKSFKPIKFNPVINKVAQTVT